MTSITVRNLDEAVKASLRLQAAQHGWSMEQEVRHILQQAVATQPAEAWTSPCAINRRFHRLAAEDLPLPCGEGQSFTAAGTRCRKRLRFPSVLYDAHALAAPGFDPDLHRRRDILCARTPTGHVSTSAITQAEILTGVAKLAAWLR